MKIPPVEAVLFRAERETDGRRGRQTDLTNSVLMTNLMHSYAI